MSWDANTATRSQLVLEALNQQVNQLVQARDQLQALTTLQASIVDPAISATILAAIEATATEATTKLTVMLTVTP